MQLDFDGDVFYWRGPSPFHFVAVPEPESAEIHAVAAQVTYGWGVIPAQVQVGATSFTTSLFPRDGGYVVPLKSEVRRVESIELGDSVHVRLMIEVKF
ncbi:MAG TPA: DUF1905 domain-containing protein [Acidimicrobiales bacterium]|nr:DUF1905 domain-containing protein [Acidimicrobiales bacterium]